MSYPFVTPSAYRIHCTPGAAIDVSLNGAIKSGDVRGVPLSFNFYGDAGFLFALGDYIALLRVKSNGQWCWYSNTTFANFRSALSGAQVDLVNFIGSNYIRIFSYRTGTHYGEVVPLLNHFVNGGYINFVTSPFNFPPCPCGAGYSLDNAYFDAQHNLMLCTYSHAFANAYDLWAGVYQISYENYSTLNEGYCGNFLNGTDPIANKSNYSKVRGGITYGLQGSNQFTFDQNGNFIGRDINFTDTPSGSQYFATGNVRVTVGNLNCAGTSQDYPVYDLTINTVLDQNNPVFAGYYFQVHSASNLTGATDIANCVASANTYQSMILFNGETLVELYHMHPNSYSSGAVFLNNTGIALVAAFNQGGVPYNLAVYLSTPDSAMPSLNPPPVINGQTTQQILNWHRPISTQGLYKT